MRVTRVASVAIALLFMSVTTAQAAKGKDKSGQPAAEKKEKRADKQADKQADAPREVIKRESKIEFDERSVQGQRAQGAVYLFQRAESRFTSLVKTPDSFRDRTLRTVFGKQQND